MLDERLYAIDRTTGDVIYRIPGHQHGDGQVDSDERPVWLLAPDQEPDDYDALPRVTVED